MYVSPPFIKAHKEKMISTFNILLELFFPCLTKILLEIFTFFMEITFVFKYLLPIWTVIYLKIPSISNTIVMQNNNAKMQNNNVKMQNHYTKMQNGLGMVVTTIDCNYH